MSYAHGGYDDSQLREVAGGDPIDDVRSRMESYAEGLPRQDGESTESTAPPLTPDQTIPPPSDKRVKATPKKLKKVLGDIPSKILEANGVELDDDDRDALDEASEMMAGVFGFEFSIPESRFLIKSRFLAVVWVAGVAFLVWFKHRMPDIWKMISSETRKDKKDERKTPSVQD